MVWLVSWQQDKSLSVNTSVIYTSFLFTDIFNMNVFYKLVLIQNQNQQNVISRMLKMFDKVWYIAKRKLIQDTAINFLLILFTMKRYYLGLKLSIVKVSGDTKVKMFNRAAFTIKSSRTSQICDFLLASQVLYQQS